MSTTRSRAEARRADVDAVLGDRSAAVAHLLDQAEDRAAEGQEIAEIVAREHRRRVLEEDLGRLVGAGEAAVRRDHHDRMRQRVQNRVCDTGERRLHRHVHAAAASAGASKAEIRSRLTARGSLALQERAAKRGRDRRFQSVEIPAEMLSRDAHAFADSVMREDHLVVFEDERAERVSDGSLRRCPAGEQRRRSARRSRAARRRRGRSSPRRRRRPRASPARLPRGEDRHWRRPEFSRSP